MLTWFTDRRFRPSFMPTIACFAFIPLCLHLSAWQMGKYINKTELQEKWQARMEQIPITLPKNTVIDESLHFLRVMLSGEYHADKAFLLDNQLKAGNAGFHAFAPFRLDDGQVIMVNRGWLPFAGDYKNLPKQQLPEGKITIQGHLARFYEVQIADRYLPNIGDEVWQSMNRKALQAMFQDALVSMTLRLDLPDSNAQFVKTAPRLDWAQPALRTNQNFSYAWQWRIIAVAALFAWFFLSWQKKNVEADQEHVDD